MLDSESIGRVVDLLGRERTVLLELLGDLTSDQWAASTECPEYTVKGIATHILGDDLSLLSRQRDEAENGLTQLASKMPDANFRTLLDTFNDRWVAAAEFLSPKLLVVLLAGAGDWTSEYYASVDPDSPGEVVGFFGDQGPTSPFWKAIAREYLERWVHHSQIRRAIGLGALCDHEILSVGLEIVASAAGMKPTIGVDPNDAWALGPIGLGKAQQAADILTRGRTAAEIAKLATGPDEAVGLLAALAGRDGA